MSEIAKGCGGRCPGHPMRYIKAIGRRLLWAVLFLIGFALWYDRNYSAKPISVHFEIVKPAPFRQEPLCEVSDDLAPYLGTYYPCHNLPAERPA